MATTTINSTRYANGERITEQTVTYKLSDDLMTRVQLGASHAHCVKRLEELNAEYADEGTAVERRTAIAAEIARVNADAGAYSAKIVEQEAIITGYSAE